MVNSTTYLQRPSILQSIKWQNVIVYCILISAFIPKIVLAGGVNIFLPEIFLFISLIFGIRQYITFPEQRFLLGIFLCMLFFSLLAQVLIKDVGAVLRSFKEILYIPIIFWASKIKDKQRLLKKILTFGCIALAVNIFNYIQTFSTENTIWSGAETLSSGMSNRGFDPLSFKFVQLDGLAHGIWGSYCVLIYVLAFSLRNNRLIGRWYFIIISILFFINIGISVSREAIIILVIVFVLNFLKSKQSVIKRIAVVAILAIFITGIAIYGSSLPAVQKLTYTYDALSSTGSEGNAALRFNTWYAYFNFLTHNIEYIFAGTGISSENFYNHIFKYAHGDIVSVPESVIVYTQAYGGIFATICLLLLLLLATLKINMNCSYKLIKYFFVGVLLANLFTSVSMFSDLLYAHLCLIYGLLIVKNEGI